MFAKNVLNKTLSQWNLLTMLTSGAFRNSRCGFGPENVGKTPKNPMVNDHYPVFKWLFHWGYTPFSDIPMCLRDSLAMQTLRLVVCDSGHCQGRSLRGPSLLHRSPILSIEQFLRAVQDLQAFWRYKRVGRLALLALQGIWIKHD